MPYMYVYAVRCIWDCVGFGFRSHLPIYCNRNAHKFDRKNKITKCLHVNGRIDVLLVAVRSTHYVSGWSVAHWNRRSNQRMEWKIKIPNCARENVAWKTKRTKLIDSQPDRTMQYHESLCMYVSAIPARNLHNSNICSIRTMLICCSMRCSWNIDGYKWEFASRTWWMCVCVCVFRPTTNESKQSILY